MFESIIIPSQPDQQFNAFWYTKTCNIANDVPCMLWCWPSIHLFWFAESNTSIICGGVHVRDYVMHLFLAGGNQCFQNSVMYIRCCIFVDCCSFCDGLWCRFGCISTNFMSLLGRRTLFSGMMAFWMDDKAVCVAYEYGCYFTEVFSMQIVDALKRPVEWIVLFLLG